MKKEFLVLKKVLRLWRDGDPIQWRISKEEFRSGMRGLRYLPPLIITPPVFDEQIAKPGFTNACGFMTFDGFRRLMINHMHKQLMYNLAHGEWSCKKFNEMWTMGSIEAAGKAVMALSRSAKDGHRGVRPCFPDQSGDDVSGKLVLDTGCQAGSELGTEMLVVAKKCFLKMKRVEDRMQGLTEALDVKRARMRQLEHLWRIKQVGKSSRDAVLISSAPLISPSRASDMPKPLIKPQSHASKDGSDSVERDEFHAETKTRAIVRTIFEAYDQSHIGHWDVSDLRTFLFSLKNKNELRSAEAIFDSIDESSDGTIDFDEFYKWFCWYIENFEDRRMSKTRGEIRQIFDSFDDDKSGWQIADPFYNENFT